VTRQLPATGLPLHEILELEVVQRTRPELVHGRDLLDRVVRWVHTSELAEVPSLLKGGELLLTTGLGLAGRGPAAQVTYVNQLADHETAALALELGWTFKTVPEALVAAARQRDLPLIALHEIVPFVEITEEIQARLVNRQIEQLRLGRDVQRLLHELLLHQEGLSGLITALSQLAGCPVVLETTGGQTVAFAGLELGSAAKAIKTAERVETAFIDVLGELWGSLHFIDPSPASAEIVGAALEHGPTAVALSLLRNHQTMPLHERLRRDFVEDLLAGRYASTSDLAARAGLLGFQVRPHDVLAGFALGDYGPEDSDIAVRSAEAAVAETGGGLVAEVDSVVFGIVAAAEIKDAQTLADRLLARVETSMLRRGASQNPRLALGALVRDIESLGRSLRDARATLDVIQELRTVERAVTARGMAADRLIAKLIDDPELASIVEDELGPLLRHDAAHRSDLVKTLSTYLAHGSSKTRAAQALHLRRQSLYQRLSKIEELIGENLDDPARRGSLTLVLKANEVIERRRRE